MGIKADLLKLYFQVEASYYALCDWLEKQKIPIYEYFVTPIESNKYPSFPVAVGALLLIIALIVLVLSSLSFAPVVKTVHVNVAGADSVPVQGALVELISVEGQVVASATTNETGEVFFDNRKNAVQVKVTHVDYQPLSTAVREQVTLSLRLKTDEVEVQPQGTAGGEEEGEGFSGDVTQFIEGEQFGSFEVALRRLGTSTSVEGVVRVFDSATDNQIAEVQSVGGVVVFEDLPLNQHVYFHALSQGFLSNRTEEFTVTRQRQSVVIPLMPVQVVNTTVSVISSATRQPLSGVSVKLYDEFNVPIANATTAASGNLTFSLASGVRYYINAKKDTFLTNVTAFFQPNQNMTIALLPASEGSVSVLKVNLRDEYNESIQGIASLYTSDNRIIDQLNTPSALHEFKNLPLGLSVNVKVSSHDLTSQRSLTLTDALHEIFISLELRFAFVSLHAYDALTRTEVQGASAVSQRNESIENCTVPCVFRVKTRGTHSFTLTHSDYFNYTFQFLASSPTVQVFEENATVELNASLMPFASVIDSQIILNGVFDRATYEQVPDGGTLKQNRVYVASLSGYFANAIFATVFFSPSNTKPQKISILNFTPYPFQPGSPDGLDIIATNSPTITQCGSSLSGSKWRRMLSTIPRLSPAAFSQHYTFYFVAEVPMNTNDLYNSLEIAYKSLIKKQNGDTIRNPFDQALGTSELQTSGAGSDCNSTSFKSVYNVISPNQAINSVGTLTLSLFQNRNLSVLRREVSPLPQSCGTPITSATATIESFDSFDCNGFRVDSGFAQIFTVNAKIRLNANAKGGMVKLSANPTHFTVLNASYIIPGTGRQMYLSSQPAAVFEQDISSIMLSQTGVRDIEVQLNLSAAGFSDATDLVIDFREKYENGTVSDTVLSKTISVSLNEITASASQSLLSGFSCGNESTITFKYDDGLLATGSGWVGCNEIPLIVDPIFPADAVPIYIQNTTTQTDCTTLDASGANFVPSFQLEDPAPSALGPNGQNCFELVPDSPLIVENGGVFKGYLLKFNAMKCGGVTGNKVFTPTATLNLTCLGRATQGNVNDVKSVKITVINTGGEWLKNFVLTPLVSSVDFKNGSTAPIDPKVYAVIDNLQLRPQTSEQGYDRGERALSFRVLPAGGAEFETIKIVDQPAKAFAVAIRSSLAPGVYSFEDPTKAAPAENGEAFAMESLPYFASASNNKPFLEYVEEAETMRLATAFRRTLSVYGSLKYWCIEGAPPSIDRSVCRPTINDWIANVPATSTQTQVCTPCSASNCDSTCSVTEPHVKPDGSPCLNWCGAPRCDSPAICNPTTRTKQVSIPGRTTQQWQNTSRLVSVPLYQVDDFAFYTANGVDAPFKYFPEYAKSFNYSIIAFVDKDCKDSPGHFERSDTCFADSGTKRVLRRFGPVPGGIDNIWFGSPSSGEGDAKYGTLRLSEQKGGCSQSTVWDRGHYRITFSYVKTPQGWEWQYSASPLEVSASYVQLDSARDTKHCAARTLEGGSQENPLRTNLCYFVFSTSAPVTSEGANPGYCVRSLRDYIPRYADEHGSDSDPSNDNFIPSGDLAQLDLHVADDRMPQVPDSNISGSDSTNHYFTSLIRQTVRENILLRNLELSGYGRPVCHVNRDTGSRTPWVSCMGGPVCVHDYRLSVPPPEDVDFRVGKFGVTPAGNIDWLANVSFDVDPSRDTCDDTFWGSDWDNWDGDEGDTAYTFRYDAVGFNGKKKEGGPFLCHTGCYIDCDSEFWGGCPGSYD